MNDGRPVSNVLNDALRTDITFSGHTPFVSWQDTVGGEARTFVAHLDGERFALDTPGGIGAPSPTCARRSRSRAPRQAGERARAPRAPCAARRAPPAPPRSRPDRGGDRRGRAHRRVPLAAGAASAAPPLDRAPAARKAHIRRAQSARRMCVVTQRDRRVRALGSARADSTMQRRDQPALMPGTARRAIPPPVGAPVRQTLRTAIVPAGRLAFQGAVRTE